MCYVLPKLWMGRIQKYWDKIMPSDFPASDSIFDLKFDTEEETAAVVEFENTIGTSESIAIGLVPEGTVVSNYIGTYDVKGTPGVETLLSPEKVSSENVLALHLEDGEWKVVEGIKVVDGYIWGTLDSFSPVAIIEYRKDIHVEELANPDTGKYIVCEGNVVRVTQTEDGKTVLRSESTGTEIEITEKVFIVGGSVDGTPITKTSVTVDHVNDANVNKIYCGSIFWSNEDEPVPTEVGEANVSVFDSSIEKITGSSGMVRTKVVNFNIINTTNTFIGAGESYNTVLKEDCNTADCSYASLGWTRKVNINLENVTSQLVYGGGNIGYYFVDETEINIKGGKIDYLLSAGSNGITNKSIMTVSNDAVIGVLQNVNCGIVDFAKVTLSGVEVKSLAISGNPEDKTVTGISNKVRFDINGAGGLYNIIVGTQGSKKLTVEEIKTVVDAVKVSRSTNITISDEDLVLLGYKYIVK